MITWIVIALFLIGCIWILFFRRNPALEHLKAEIEEEINERNRMAVAMKAWETGKPVVGEVDENGKLTMRVLDSLDHE